MAPPTNVEAKDGPFLGTGNLTCPPDLLVAPRLKVEIFLSNLKCPYLHFKVKFPLSYNIFLPRTHESIQNSVAR